MSGRRELYGPDGSLRFSTGDGGGIEVILPDGGCRMVLDELWGLRSHRLCTAAQVLAICEKLGFVSSSGCPPGFLVVLPRGVFFGEAVEVFNLGHARALDASRVDFPLLFDRSSPEIAAITETFERQGRMFRFDDRDANMRLAYAADPALLTWLQGRSVELSALPYVVYSPTQVFRRRLRGEISMTTQHQYMLPDLHALCDGRDAPDVYEMMVREAGERARFLFDDGCAQFLEVAPSLAERFPSLGANLARAAGLHTVVRYLERQSRYFVLKGGIDVHMGTGLLMLFNFQWDESNAERFDVCTRDGRPVTIIHSTLAGGLAKVLPAIVGRGLSGQAPRSLPVEFAPVQITVLPVNGTHEPHAHATAERLRGRGLRTDVQCKGTMTARVRRLRDNWNPFHVVVGDREAAGGPLFVESPASRSRRSLDDLLAACGERIEICRPSHAGLRLDLPFV